MTIPRGWWVGGVAVTALAVLAAGRVLWRPPAAVEVATVRVWNPLPHVVQVEVLNAGGVSQAGRAGMLLLRRARLDVVYVGNAAGSQRGHERNRILIRRGDTTGVGRVLEALGDAEIIREPDTTRLVDLTVLLGKQFRVPQGH